MKKRFFAAFLCVVMLTSMLAAITVSAAEGAIARVSLSGNTTFYSSEVEGKTLNVVAYDAEGNEVSLEGKTVTYTSTRPWVFEIGANGTIIDNNYDGTTLVSATVDGVTGSTIMIKSTSNTAATAGFENNLTPGSRDVADGKAYAGYSTDNTSSKNDTNSRIPGEKYFGAWTNYLYYNGACDNTVEEGGAGIRVAQGWFYDDMAQGAGYTFMYISLVNWSVEKVNDTYKVGDVATAVTDGTNGYIPAWANVGNSSILDATVGPNGKGGYYFHGQVNVSKDNADYYGYTDTNYLSSVKRSKGWHQVTLIMDDNANVHEYIDGIKVNTDPSIAQKPKTRGTFHSEINQNITAAGDCDDFVFAQNLNTEEPPELQAPVKSISLSRNKTFITSVDANAKLIVIGLDENGNEVELPADTEFEYESTRPWVLDIDDETGKFIDGENDGTTKVTVTANGMTASTIFIKNSNNVYAEQSYQTADEGSLAGAVDNIGDGFRFRGTYIEATDNLCKVNVDGNATDAEKAAAKIPGQNYYNLPTGREYTPRAGDAITSGYDIVTGTAAANQYGWYKAGLRVIQGWFYDDGTSPVHMRSYMAQHFEYLDEEAQQIQRALNGIGHLSWQADIKANAGGEEYYIDYQYGVTNNTENTIARSKGWHQVTTILNDDLTVDVFVDGNLLSTSRGSTQVDDSLNIYCMGVSAGNFDELVVAANPNTTAPMTITASATDGNGTVEPASIPTNEGKTVEFTVTPNEGFVVDTITYDGKSLPATNNKVSVTAAAGATTLSVTFKEDVKLPSVTSSYNSENGITYITINEYNTGVVSEAGILFGIDGVSEMLRLIGYSSYDEINKKGTPITEGDLAIKVNSVSGLTKDTDFIIKPFVRYTNGGDPVDAVNGQYTQSFAAQ